VGDAEGAGRQFVGGLENPFLLPEARVREHAFPSAKPLAAMSSWEIRIGL
jgi:hypothetical protein